MIRAFAVVCAAFGLNACSVTDPHPDWVSRPPAAAVEQVLSGTALMGRRLATTELPLAPLDDLPPELQRTAEELYAAHSLSWRRAEALHHRLLKPVAAGGLGLSYRPWHPTLLPEQAFATREVNCLSYTLIYVAMAQRMGLRAEVNDVRLPPAWDMRDASSLMLMRHVNAKVFLPRNEILIVDLDMQRYDPIYSQATLDGKLTEALYHSNRGMEVLAEGETLTAFKHLRRALDLDPDRSYIWNNLGNLYFRNQRLPEAETAYLQGLWLEPDNLTIVSNLGTLYTVLGKLREADHFRTLARSWREANPYYTFAKAQVALDEGELEEARLLALKAIDRQGDEPRFYTLAATVYERLGDTDRAIHMQQRADAIIRKRML